MKNLENVKKTTNLCLPTTTTSEEEMLELTGKKF